MECYTSDSGDSDSRELKTLDLSNRTLDTRAAEDEFSCIIHEKQCAERYEIVHLDHNRIVALPSLDSFINLRVLDVSYNRLTSLPDALERCPLTHLIAKNNNLKNDSLPKCFTAENSCLKELNLSGNLFNFFPKQILELTSLKFLYLAGNQIVNVPKDIWKLSGLQILGLGGNQISEVPESVGRLTHLQALLLSDNQLEHLPNSIADLKHLRQLKLNKNRLKTLPTQIVKLKCLTELSLRDNPLVVRFIRDMTLQPASLLELAGRTVKLHAVPWQSGDLPRSLHSYLDSAHCCVNPKCRGVFFDNRVEHIKFVDFCGMYRIPLLQYLCSARCITGGWESRETDAPPPHSHMMRKVLLG